MIQLTGMIVNILCQKLLKNRAPVLRRRDHTRYSDMKLKSGWPAAHQQTRLMLLPSGPDMVHGS